MNSLDLNSATFIDLAPFDISRSEKVLWRLPYLEGDVLDYLKSSSLKSFLKKIDQILADHGITWELKNVTRDEYVTWLSYYTEKMQENGFDILATEAWYDNRVAKGRQIQGMFFYRAGQLIGSGIITREGTDKATFAFKATDRIDLTNKNNSSLGAVVDYFFMRSMAEEGVKIISSGKSRNAFGVINNFGYLDYKLRFGYLPSLVTSAPLVQSVPVNQDGVVLFFGQRSDKLHLFALVPTGSDHTFEQARFDSPELPFELLRY